MTKRFTVNRSSLSLMCRVVIVCWVLLIPADTGARTGQFKENVVKATFLYNLTNFITWSQGTFPSGQSVFRLAIIGKDPFGSVLDRIVEGEKVQGKHPIVIQRITEISELDTCHLLFVSASDKDQWQRIFDITEGAPILTVSDGERFAHNGGMINLVHKAQRINIEINVDLLKQRGFAVSAKLLKLSTIIEP